MADERIVLDGDASALVSAFKEAKAEAEATRKRIAGLSAEFDGLGEDADDARKSVERLAKQMQKTALDNALKKALGANAKETNKFAVEAERMNRVSQMLGGTFGDLTGGLDDFATLMTGGAGAVTAFGAAAVVTVAGVGMLSAMVVQTIANTTEYVETLNAMERSKWDEQIEASLEAEAALSNLKETASDLQFLIASDLAPTVALLSDSLTGLSAAATDLTGSGVGETLADMLRTAIPSVALFEAYGAALRVTADETQRLTEEVKGLRDAYDDEYNAMMLALGMTVETEEATKRQTRAYKSQTSALRELREARKAETDLAMEGVEAMAAAFGDGLGAMLQEQRAIANTTAMLDEKTAAQMRYNEAQIEQGVISTNAVRDLERVSAADAARIDEGITGERVLFEDRAAKASQWLALTDQAVSGIAGITESMIESGIISEKKAAKARINAQILQAISGTSLAVINALTVPPPLGIALAVTTGAMGIAQTAVIAQQANKLHTGGFAQADERAGPHGTRILDNERTAVFTAEGARNIGLNEDTLQRINGGLGGSQQSSRVVVIERTGETRGWAQSERSMGYKS